MKKQFITSGLIIFSFMLPLKATAATENFTELYVFGDSLSDGGNVFQLTGGLFPPSPLLAPQTSPYDQGRFSNGDVWVDYLGKELGLKPTLFADLNPTIPTQGINFAVGGGTSGLFNAFVPTSLTGVRSQVQTFTDPFKANNLKVNPTALYTVWTGGNDYLFGNLPLSDPNLLGAAIDNVIANLEQNITALADVGAKNILVFNLPNLGNLPVINSNPQLASLYNSLTATHNFKLNSTLTNLRQTRGINIIEGDVNSLFNTILSNPSSFGFKNISEACLTGTADAIRAGNFQVCNNPNEYLFFDTIHPTTEGHRLIAKAALSAIKPKSVPEPSTVLGTLAIAACGATAMRKRKLSS
jgi:phospholipase/lecithinase/hemolysin